MMLDRITKPNDVKKLTLEEFGRLADCLRAELSEKEL